MLICAYMPARFFTNSSKCLKSRDCTTSPDNVRASRGAREMWRLETEGGAMIWIWYMGRGTPTLKRNSRRPRDSRAEPNVSPHCRAHCRLWRTSKACHPLCASPITPSASPAHASRPLLPSTLRLPAGLSVRLLVASSFPPSSLLNRVKPLFCLSYATPADYRASFTSYPSPTHHLYHTKELRSDIDNYGKLLYMSTVENVKRRVSRVSSGLQEV